MQTVEQYIQKIKNRVEFISKEDRRVESKIEKMKLAVQAREKILVQKWHDHIMISECQSN